MDIEPSASHYRELLVFLIAAGLVVPFAHRLRISPVLTFLVVGILIGPYGLAASIPALGGILITHDEAVRFLAELGVVFLLFTIGLDLSLRRLISMRHLVFGLGALQIVATAAAIGATAIAFGNSLQSSIVLGLALALSSTAIVMQILTDRGRLGTRLGRASFAILLMQDLAVIPILFMTASLTGAAEGQPLLGLARALGIAVLVVAAILSAGRLLVSPLLRFAGSTRSPDIFMASALLIVLATGMATAQAGLSVALGAFLAGLLFSDTEFRHEIEVSIAPFRGLLIGLFFMSIGMGINVGAIVSQPLWVPASVIGLAAIKTVILVPLALAFRLPLPVAAELGLLLSQGGEFAFVVVGAAMQVGAIERGVGDFVLLVTGASMVLAPLVTRLAEAMGRRLERRGAADLESPASSEETTPPVLIAGFGRVGQMLSQLLEAHGFPFLAVERDFDIVRSKRVEGAPVLYGDAGRPETLRRLKIGAAAALVVTTDDGVAAEHIVAAARSEAPGLLILARARDARHARDLIDRGADEAVPEAIEASLQLAEVLLTGIGLPEEAVVQSIEERRGIELAGVRRNEAATG